LSQPYERYLIFPWLGEGEEVLLFRRKHPYVLAVRLLIPAIILTLPLALGVIGLSVEQVLISYVFVGPLAAVVFLWFYLDWENDYYVLTNRRIVHQERVLFIREERSEAALERVQDVTLLRPGPLAMLFGFGHLVIETAGTGGHIQFNHLPEPNAMRESILAQVARLNGRKMKPMAGLAAKEEIPGKGLSQLLREYLLPRLRLEEEGVVTWRKHWYVLLKKTIALFVLLLLVVEMGVAALLGLPLASFLPRSTTLGLSATLVTLLLLLLLYRYEDWRNDIYVLTDDRIIDIERKPLFLGEERREASLSKIQDVRYVIPGVMYNLLNVGSVIMETAATEGEFTFDWVHDPRGVQEEIFARVEAFKEREKRDERQTLATEIRGLLEGK
jgi:membrane protein YdbS with pleckstrin-like domain